MCEPSKTQTHTTKTFSGQRQRLDLCSLPQDDCAKDDDLHSVIASKLDKNFTRKGKDRSTPDQEAAVSLMTVSTLRTDLFLLST